MNTSTKAHCKENTSLRRSKSLCSLRDELKSVHKDIHLCNYDHQSGGASECSEVFAVHESDSEVSNDHYGTSNGNGNFQVFSMLDNKIDGLSELFLEQCRLLSEIKGQIEDSKLATKKYDEENRMFFDIVNFIIKQRTVKEREGASEGKERSRARCLLDAIEMKEEHTFDKEFKTALNNFLKSEELKERMVSATASSLHEVIRACFSRDLLAVYVPLIKQSQRNLLRQATRTLEDAFVELENNLSQTSRDMYQACRQLRRALNAHQNKLENAPSQNFLKTLQINIEGLLDNELKEYRQKILNVISMETESNSEEWQEPSLQSLDYSPVSPVSPLQPANPGHSIIDQLMLTALINKQMQDGDVNGSFERALSAADLSLVMVACRAVEPSRVFSPPCPLSQAVLMSLVQQLATDMVHDTQLKCRYLEEAIISLNTSDPATRAHLPMVVSEVRKHLMKFLISYPNHVANRRVTLIVMAADNLLK